MADRVTGIAVGVALTALITLTPQGVYSEEVPQDSDSLTSIVWITDYDRAVRQAGGSNKHIIVEFYTDWCEWCRKMEDSTFRDPQVVAMQERYLFARINAELDTATATRFRIGGYPTVILLEKSGNEVDRILGYVPTEEFVTTMDNYLQGVGTLWALEQENREDRNNPEIIYAIARKHMSRGNFGDARSNFDRVLSLDSKNESGVADSAQFALALLHRKERSWYKAAEEFRKVVEDYPESKLREDAQIYIGWLYGKAGDAKEALKSYRAFLKEFSKSSEKDWVEGQIESLEESDSSDDGS